MKKCTFLLVFLLTIIMGCNNEEITSKLDVKRQAPDIILKLSHKFGDPKPSSSGVESNDERYIFLVEGNFKHPWDESLEKADEISFIINHQGKITCFEGSLKGKKVWSINLQPIDWDKFIDMSPEEYAQMINHNLKR